MISAFVIDFGNYTMQFWKGWYEAQLKAEAEAEVIIPCSFGRAGMRLR